MKKTHSSLPALIAPCGINCRLCRAYTRNKNACPGCRGDDTLKHKSCATCLMKLCEKRAKAELDFCYTCAEFPCARLSHLDKRYRTRYATHVLDNLAKIKAFGIHWFVEAENIQWTCPECSEMLCMHKPQCLSCGYEWHKEK